MDYLNKTKEELLSELIDQKQELDSLKLLFSRDVADRNQIEYFLKERLKELSCHNQIAEVMSNSAFSIDEVCEKIVQIIPPSWQFSEIAEASIQIYEKVFETPNFEKTKNSLRQEIITNQQIIGHIEVCYPVDKIGFNEQTFLPEESNLLFSIAIKLGNYIGKEEKEIALRQSEAKYKDLIGNVSDVIYRTDSQANITFISPSITRLLGYLPEEVIGKNFIHFVGASREYLQKRFEEIHKNIELQNEYQILSKSGEPHWIRFSSKAIFTNEQFIGATGTLIDITEKKHIELELQKSESHYRSILTASPDTIFIADLKGNVLFTSPMALKMFGYEEVGFPLNRPLFDFVDPKDHDKARDAIGQMVEGIYTGATEYVGIKADGSTFDMEVNGEFIRDAEGQPTSMVFVVRDISDRKLAEKKLIKSEETYRNLVESINDILFEVSLDGTIKYLSPSIERLFNFKTENLIGQNFFSFVHPDDLDFLMDVFKNNRFNEYKNIEYRCFSQTGKLIWVQASAQNSYEEGKLVGRTGILHDITERKLAEEKLRKSEEQYRKLVESVNDVIYEIDTTGNIRFVSQSVTNILGYTVEEVTGRNIFSFIYPEDVPVIMNSLKSLSSRDYSFMEYRYVRKDGSVRWVRSSTTANIIDGVVISATGTLTDVTDRKIAEEKLRENEELYRSIINTSPDSITITNLEGFVIFSSPLTNKMFGINSTEDYINHHLLEFIAPSDHVKAQTNMQRMFYEYLGPIEYDAVKPDGTLFKIEVNADIIKDAEGKPSKIILNSRDITERKAIEELLHKSEEKYRNLVESVNDVMYEIDSAGNLLYLSPSVLNVLGYTVDELIGKNIFDFVPPEDTLRLMEMLNDQSTPLHEYREFRCYGKSGSVHWLRSSTTTIIKDGVWVGETGSFTDITDRKNAEEKLKKSEETYRDLVETINDVVYEVTGEGIVNYVSPSIERFLGYGPEELIGQNFFKYMHPEDRPLIIERLANLSSRDYSFMEYRYFANDGTIRWVRSSTNPIIENGKMIGGRGVLIDITERKKAEDALTQSEERLKYLISSQTNYVLWTDLEGRHIYWNKKFEEEYGWIYAEEGLDGAYSLKSICDHHHQRTIDTVSRCIANPGEIFKIELDKPAKDGSTRTTLWEFVCLTDANVPNAIQCMGIDITERKLAEEKLRESEERFRMIFENVFDGISIFEEDPDPLKRKLIDCNEQYAVMSGRTREELLELGNIYKLTKTLDETANSQRIKGISEKLSYHGSFKWLRPDGKDNIIDYVAMPITWHGKNYSIGIDRDITEYKQREEQLRKLSQAVEQSPVSIVMTDLEGNIEYANPKATQTTGYTLDELKGKNPRVLKSGETPLNEYEFLWDSISHGNIWKGIFHNKRKNGELYWESSQITPIIDVNGKIISYLALKEDITERKAVQEALQKSEERSRQIAELSITVIWEVDANGMYTFVSPVSKEVWGYEPDELVGKKYFYDLHPIEGREEFKESVLQTFAQRVVLKDLINPIVTESQKLIWVSTNGTPIIDSEDNLIGYRGADNDITEKKLAEEALKESEEALNYAQQIANMGSWSLDLTRNKLTWSKNYYHLLGVDPQTQEVSNDHFIKMVHPDDTYKLDEKLQEIYLTKEPASFDFRLVMPDGQIKWIQNNIVPVFEGNDLVSLNGVNIDITDKKLSEEALKINEEALNHAQEISKMCSWELDMITGKITWSKNYYHLMGIPEGAEMKIEFFQERVHPEDLHLVEEMMEKMKALRKPVIYDIRLRMPDNEYRWIQNNIVPEFEDEILVRFKGVNIDVTEKKLAEESIKLQNERLSAIIGAMPDLIFVADKNGTYLEYYSPKPDMLTVPDDQIVGANIKDIFDAETAQLHLRKIEECLQQQKLITYDFKGTERNSIQFFEIRLAPLGSGRVLTFVRDMTNEKIKDNEIKKLSMAVEQSPVIVVITDLDGNIEYVNPAFHAITGYTLDDVLGKNTRILKSGETDLTVYENLWNTIIAGDDWYGEWIDKKKNGELYWESISITPIRNDAGKVTNYLAIKQDITQRKQTEKEIHDLNTNLELKIEERTSQLAKTNENLLTEIKERIRVEGVLSESEKSYRTVVENVNEVIFQTDAEGLWLFLNHSWEKVTGFSVEESLGQLFVNYVHPDDRVRNWELFEPLIQRKKEYCRHEIRYLTKDGGFRWVEVFARLGLNDSDEITGTYGTLQDITERKMIEDALQTKTAELENFFDVTPDLLCIVDMKGKFIKVNNAWESTLGCSIGTLENSVFYEFVHPDDIVPTTGAMVELNEQNPIIKFTNRYKAKDGTYRFIEWHSVPVGGLIYSAARDITERKRAEDFENELLQLSPTLTGLSLNKINDAITQALSRIGQFLSADRSYIFEFDASESAMNNTHEWCNTGINPEIENLQDVPCEVLPRWMEALNRHENIVITSVKDLPESWQAEREILEPQGIKSLIVMPLLAEDTLIGFVGLDSVVAIKEYTTSEINILKVWSSMLASLINNQRSGKLLEQTRQNYETFFNTIDDFLFIFDEQGNIVDSNNTVKVRLGYSNDELTNKSVLMVRPPERRKEALCVMKEILEGKVQYCSIPLITRSGEQIPVETRIKRGYWNGSPVIFGVSKDISQIRLSEQKFASAFHLNSAVMTITRFDNDQFVDVNNAFVNTLGYSWEDIKGKTLVTLGIVRENSEEGTIQDAINGGIAVREIEINAYSKSNQLFILLLSAEEIYVGSERCILSVAVNITERKIMENELRKAREEADQANLAKSEFLSRMSHELRTPMNSILGFAQLLEMGELNARQSKGVNHIMKSGKHLLDLINEVLDISRIEAGRLSLSIEPVQLCGVIAEMIDIVKLQANERQIKLELTNSLSDQLFIKADRQRLKQVVLNLLNNAIKYNRNNGLVMIQAELRPTNAFGLKMVRLSIIDNGLGISEENLPKLFKPFERIGAEKTGTEGTGLGLSVVKKLVEAMSGSLGVESKLDLGSTFWVEFPSSESQLENAKKSGMLNSDKSKFGNKSGAILYIEDNASNIELVEQILTNQHPNLRLIANMNGKQAVPLAINYLPDLILLDLDLPDIHGSEVLQLLLGEELTKNIPVVVISADAMPQQMSRLLKAGAKNYMTKPLDVIDFLKMVDEFIPI